MKTKARSSRRSRRRLRIALIAGGAVLSVLLIAAVFVSLLRWQARTVSDQRPTIVYDDEMDIRSLDPDRALAEVLRRHLAAISSDLGLERLGSYQVGGVYEMSDGNRLDFSLVKKAPNQVRFSVTRRGMRIIQAFDGTNAWEARKLAGDLVDTTPRQPEELPELMRNAWATTDLFEPEKKGITLSYVGSSDFRGRDAFEIQGKYPNGSTSSFFIDAETFYEIGRRSRVEIDGDWIEEESIMSDQVAVDGFVFPQRVDTYRRGVLVQTQRVNEVQVNQGLFDWFFQEP